VNQQEHLFASTLGGIRMQTYDDFPYHARHQELTAHNSAQAPGNKSSLEQHRPCTT